VISSAPGKLILFGEHAVVLGKTAIATSVDLRTYVQIESNNATVVQLILPHIQYVWNLSDLQINELPPIDNPELTPAITTLVGRLCDSEKYGIFKQAMMSVLFMYIVTSRGRKQGVTITIKSQVPFGVGLGSSAAYNTSLAAGLLKFFSFDIGDDEKGDISESGGQIINKYAFQGERIMHGNPSGIDNTTSTFGGIIAYTAGQIEHLKDVPDMKLIITNTKISRNTKQLVQKVGSLHRMFPNITCPLLESVHNISQNVLKIFREFPTKKSDEAILEIESQLEIFITINHNILSALGVGHPLLDKICHISSQNHMHSKLTGAGGGGCAFTLIKKI